ncbi:MAG: metallophosphoesterase [Deltaproteobacteria bacterium]
MISRRVFLKGGLLLGGALAAEGFIFEPERIQVEEVKVEVRGLAPEFDSFTICQITDIHHSPFVGLDYIRRVVETANGLKAGLIALTGDYIDDGRKYMAPVIKCLTGLKARHGVVSVLGNHDHFIGKGYSADVIKSHGIPLLENSNVIIEEGRGAVCIGGVKDYWEDAPDCGAAFRGVDGSIPRILLCHHPDYCEYLPRDERIDLVLSGHTHGGQVRLPFSIAPVLPSDFGQKYSGGLVRLKGAAQVYVSRGIGVVTIPVRINCPPELTVIRLVAAKDPAGPMTGQ